MIRIYITKKLEKFSRKSLHIIQKRCMIMQSKNSLCRILVTVQTSTVPRGVAWHLQGNPETATRQTAAFAVCVHAFVAMKPKG